MSRPLKCNDGAMALIEYETIDQELVPGLLVESRERKQKSHSSVYSARCYICRDPEFAQLGMTLCYPCPKCGGHVAADDTVCDVCGHDSLHE